MMLRCKQIQGISDTEVVQLNRTLSKDRFTMSTEVIMSNKINKSDKVLRLNLNNQQQN
jgi:hypothetical protein